MAPDGTTPRQMALASPKEGDVRSACGCWTGRPRGPAHRPRRQGICRRRLRGRGRRTRGDIGPASSQRGARGPSAPRAPASADRPHPARVAGPHRRPLSVARRGSLRQSRTHSTEPRWATAWPESWNYSSRRCRVNYGPRIHTITTQNMDVASREAGDVLSTDLPPRDGKRNSPSSGCSPQQPSSWKSYLRVSLRSCRQPRARPRRH